jgi:predicted RNA binding protein YcfA (HicA-like mRNA interferase family)
LRRIICGATNHGKKEIGKGLVEKIKRDLGLK